MIKKYLDKYDKEFANIIIEIKNKSLNFGKENRLKINSWIKSLCLPTDNISWKKNRNLYSLKLLDNILDGKLEPPFSQFPKESINLPMLDKILVKSQLTKKINEINFNDHSKNRIPEFSNLSEKNESNRLKRAKTPKYGSSNHFLGGNGIMDEIHKTIQDKNDDFSQGDKLLNKKYFNFNKNLTKELEFYKNTNPSISNYPNKKNSLKLTIEYLQNESNIKNQIIKKQGMDIEILKKRVIELEKKVKYNFIK